MFSLDLGLYFSLSGFYSEIRFLALRFSMGLEMLFISKGFHQSFNYAVEIKIIKIDKGESDNIITNKDIF